MAVKLHIIEPSYGEALTEPFEVPDGHIITVRRHSQGADVFVVPGKCDARAETPAEPGAGFSIKVPGMCDHCGALVGFGVKGDRALAERSEAAGAPHLRDKAAALVDKARARLLDARAEKIERETAAEYSASPGDVASPTVACSWTVETVKSTDGTPSIVLHLIGDGSRAHQVTLSISLASSLGGGLSEAVALALIEAQRER